jgi:hypothetical protein
MPEALLSHTESPVVTTPKSTAAHWPVAVAVTAAAALGLVLASVGWTLVEPGASLMRPTVTVLGAGAVVVLVAWVAACFAVRTRWLWTFAVTAAAATALAGAWTFYVVLPASVVLDPAATSQARSALAQAAAHQDARGIVRSTRCTSHGTAGIGPLAAPYHQCTIWTPLAHLVLFEAWGPGRSGGLGYIASARPGVTTFPDQCVRHLVGNWWAFGDPSDAGGDPGQCPIGYRFEGGG